MEGKHCKKMHLWQTRISLDLETTIKLKNNNRTQKTPREEEFRQILSEFKMPVSMSRGKTSVSGLARLLVPDAELKLHLPFNKELVIQSEFPKWEPATPSELLQFSWVTWQASCQYPLSCLCLLSMMASDHHEVRAATLFIQGQQQKKAFPVSMKSQGETAWGPMTSSWKNVRIPLKTSWLPYFSKMRDSNYVFYSNELLPEFRGK